MTAFFFSKEITAIEIDRIEKEHLKIFQRPKKYLFFFMVSVLLMLLYYLYFLFTYGVEFEMFIKGSYSVFGYFANMFIWKDVQNWPVIYIFEQIAITFGIVFIGTFTASFIALPLSFMAARNIMNKGAFKLIAMLVRRFFDVCRGVDMAIWGLIFVRAVGLGPLAGSLAIIVQDIGVFGKLYAEGHEAVEKRPTKGLISLGANSLQTHRFGIFTQSFPAFLALTLYQLESNTRSASVLGFVGAGGIGLVYAENMRLWNWDIVMFITLILVIVVMLIDKLSSILRRKYIIGEEVPIFTAPSV
ncbi:phosphonate ABC transporter, permease protein PhnE [Thorsellia kenyensis]|uniref:Phosphonate ABC transporter, permease protein PhnE n=1 Tax=Thorsellia kenyensis TaxID=1549888 RepID=A0ABV6C6L1_9GAMM